VVVTVSEQKVRMFLGDHDRTSATELLRLTWPVVEGFLATDPAKGLD